MMIFIKLINVKLIEMPYTNIIEIYQYNRISTLINNRPATDKSMQKIHDNLKIMIKLEKFFLIIYTVIRKVQLTQWN